MTPAFGSVGAARVLRAATGRGKAWRQWALPVTLVATVEPSSWPRRVGWHLYADSALTGERIYSHEIDRDTARLLLRGLLLPGMVAEFVGWLQVGEGRDTQLRAGMPQCQRLAVEEQELGYARALDDVLARLREMEVTR